MENEQGTRSNVNVYETQSSVKILVVEDDEALLSLVQKYLSRTDIHTKCVPNGTEAIAWIANNPVSLILLDYSLPDMTGRQFIKTLAERQCNVPFIIMTGHGDEKIAVEMMKLGARDYVVKESTFLDILPEIVNSVLEQLDTEKRLAEAEETLRESEERYRTLFESVSDGIIAVDKYGNIFNVNRRAEEILGYQRDEMIGKSFKEISTFDSKDWQSLLDKFSEAIEGKVIPEIELEITRKDGSKAFVEVITNLIKRDDVIEGTVAIVRDITEQKRIEAERKEMERKAQLTSRLATVGKMASGIAHEINNPLTGVIGYAQLVMQRDIPEDIRKEVEIINDGAQRVANIVVRLLTFARQHKPERKYVNINQIIESTLSLRAHEMDISNIKVKTLLDANPPKTKADGSQLQQVFLNIVLNAEKEMKSAHRKGNLLVKTEAINNTIRISFQDDGPGIAEENLERIFDPFFTTRETGDGAGLGLSVCHGIIAEHNGKIWAESELGKGATFIVELPVVTEPEQPEMAEPATDKARRVTGKKILVVDDEPVVRQFLSQMLTDAGHKVQTVNNASDALERIKTGRYSLILLDIKMPGMSGIEFYRHIQKIAESLAKRIVFITGDVMGEDTREFLDKTKAHYLTKPFKKDQLGDEIDRILKKD